MSTLLHGAQVQLRVIGALTLRETRTRFGGHALGYVWALAEPLFWILTIYGLFVLVGREAPDRLDVFGFLATGIVTYELVIKTQERVGQSIAGNKALLFYPQVQPLDLVVARVALELALQPLEIRGFGHVKDAAAAAASVRRTDLLAAFAAGGWPRAHAAE